MKLTATPIVLVLTYFLLPMVAAHPLTEQVKRQDQIDNPESPALARNGPLPSGMEQQNGFALNATSFPDSVADAMKGLLGGNVREASQAEIDDHLFYVKLSAAAYCRTVIPLGLFTCKHCDKSLKMIKTFSTLVDDTNVMVLRGDQQKKIYVVFRGTNSVRSFVVDAKFSLADYPLSEGAKVHKGFLASYNAVRDKLLQTVQDQAHQYSDYQVAVTGHSLGGAQAVLHALDLLNVNGTRFSADNLLLYTQGQPRVGNLKFAQYELASNIPVKRLTSKRDMIPHLPPAPLYFNAGEEYWIPGDDNNKIKVCPNGLESPHCANSISPFTSLMDHLSYMGVNMGLCL